MIKSIVVGVDRSDGSRAALRFALDEAKAHGAELTVIHAWEVAVPYMPIVGAPVFTIGGLPELERGVAAASENVVDELVDALGDTGGVSVHRRTVRGNPATVLLDAATDADLLVVGSRGHGGFTGLLLGSVSGQCAHHARCPVAIVRPPAG